MVKVTGEQGSKLSNTTVVLICIGISICSIAFMMLMGPSYETNDDWSIAWQLSSGLGSLSTFLSPYLSLCFSYLYSWQTNLPWWSVFALCCGGFLMFVLTYMTFRRHTGIIRYALIAVWFAAIWVGCVGDINFTRTAIVMSLAGGLLLFQSTTESKEHKILIILEVVLGIILFTIGFMIRFNGALITVIFLLLAFIYYYVSFCEDKKEKIKYITAASIRIALAAAIVIIMQLATVYYWNSHEDWKEYQDYNLSRGMIQDYAESYPTWKEAQSEYEALGFQKGDETLLLSNWFSEDTKVYSHDALKNMTSLSKSENNIMESMGSLIINTIINPIFWLILSVYAIVLWSTSGRKIKSSNVKKRRIAVAINVVAAASIVFYFTLLGRMELRVFEPILLCVLINIFLVINPEKQTENEKDLEGIHFNFSQTTTHGEFSSVKSIKVSIIKVIVITLCAVTFVSITAKDIINMNMPSYFDCADASVRSRLDYFDTNRDKVYMMPITGDNWEAGFGIWEPIPADYCPNLFFLGGWMARTPTNVNNLADLGIENPAESLAKDERVYSLNDERIFKFLKRHYGKNITCTQVDAFPKVGGPVIVKYTLPIEIQEKKKKNGIDLSKIKFNRVSETDLWQLIIKDRTVYKNIYCNAVVGGETYTYIVEKYDDESGVGYEGYFFDMQKLIDKGIDEFYLIGKTDDGKTDYLGSIYELIENDNKGKEHE